jgi:hypothetical protein
MQRRETRPSGRVQVARVPGPRLYCSNTTEAGLAADVPLHQPDPRLRLRPSRNTMPRHLLLFLLALVSACAGSAASSGTTTNRAVSDDPGLFDARAVGFTLIRPAGWHFAPSSWQREQLARLDFGSDEFNQLIRTRASEPLVTITKYPDTQDSVNPTIKVIYRPLKGAARSSAVAVATAVVEEMKSAFEWFEPDGPIQQDTVGGLVAGRFQFRFTIEMQDGRFFDIVNRSWVVPRGDFIFLIGMSAPAEGPDVSTAEFDQAFSSIQISAHSPQ